MSATDDRIEAEAIQWCLRAPTMGAEDWLALTEWLEADPRHAAAYQHASQSELDGDEILAANDFDRTAKIDAPPQPAAEPLPDHRSWWRAGLAAAAAALAVIGGTLAMQQHSTLPSEVIATKAGASRTLRLPDGSRVHLNGGSRLAVAVDHDRRVRLLAGEAYFEITHHDDKPFELAVGSTTLRDVGTAFDVIKRTDGFDVAVREGTIAIDPEGANQMLGAGKAAHLADQAHRMQISAVAADAVGSWRTGSLSFNDAPLSDVAADIGRSLGKHISVDAPLAQRRFSGTIKISHDDRVMSARLGGLLGVETIVRPDGWQLRSGPRAIHQ